MMMKAELKSADEEVAKEKKRRERQEKIDAASAKREKNKSKRIVNTKDRLLDDKVWSYFLID